MEVNVNLNCLITNSISFFQTGLEQHEQVNKRLGSYHDFVIHFKLFCT